MRRSILLLFALFALLLAGCGGSSSVSEEEYEKTIVLTRDRVDAALADIPEAATVKEYIANMIDASKRIGRAADQLDDAGVADGYEDETTKLSAALHELSVDINGTAEQVQIPGFEGILLAKGFNWPSWDRANAVFADLKKQGIAVEPIARH